MLLCLILTVQMKNAMCIPRVELTTKSNKGESNKGGNRLDTAGLANFAKPISLSLNKGMYVCMYVCIYVYVCLCACPAFCLTLSIYRM